MFAKQRQPINSDFFLFCVFSLQAAIKAMEAHCMKPIQHIQNVHQVSKIPFFKLKQKNICIFVTSFSFQINSLNSEKRIFGILN